MRSRPVEIACDESGYEGEKLIGSTTQVFAHGSVRLDRDEAAAFMQELRDRIRSPATEYKANHVLRGKHRAVLEWMLGPQSPLSGQARVYLIDKAFYVLGKLVELLVAGRADSGLEPDQVTRAVTRTLHMGGAATFGPVRWGAFLLVANDLMRPRSSGAAFFDGLDDLVRDAPAGPVKMALSRLRSGQAHAEAFRARTSQAPALGDRLPALDPLPLAIRQAVLAWGHGPGPVAIVHDRQNTLPATRIAVLISTLDGRLARVDLVDSFTTPTVQVADVLAGAVRKVAEDELRGEGDATLTALLGPFVDPASIWGDDRSWSRIAPVAGRPHRDRA